MSIFVNNSAGESASWVKSLAQQLPDHEVLEFADVKDKSAVEYAVIWHHPHGDLATYPNLKAVLNLGAGTDHLDQDYALPQVPYVRLIDPDVGKDMAHYVLYWVMHFHRFYERYRAQSRSAHWQRHEMPRSQDYRVTVLGQGRIGGYISQQLALNDFASQGWNRSAKSLPGVTAFTAQAGLLEVLPNTDVLVNCLPLNEQTRGMFDLARLSQLPFGAKLINISRGGIIDDDALLELIKSGHIAGAALDTFSQEPLASDSPFWKLPNVFVTPHMSGATYAKTAALVVADNIRRIERGEAPYPIHQPPAHCFA